MLLKYYIGGVVGLTGFYVRKQLWASENPYGQAFNIIYYMLTSPLLFNALRHKVQKMTMRYRLRKLQLIEEQREQERAMARQMAISDDEDNNVSDDYSEVEEEENGVKEESCVPDQESRRTGRGIHWSSNTHLRIPYDAIGSSDEEAEEAQRWNRRISKHLSLFSRRRGGKLLREICAENVSDS
jgi:hypothetical protein